MLTIIKLILNFIIFIFSLIPFKKVLQLLKLLFFFSKKLQSYNFFYKFSLLNLINYLFKNSKKLKNLMFKNYSVLAEDKRRMSLDDVTLVEGQTTPKLETHLFMKRLFPEFKLVQFKFSKKRHAKFIKLLPILSNFPENNVYVEVHNHFTAIFFPNYAKKEIIEVWINPETAEKLEKEFIIQYESLLENLKVFVPTCSMIFQILEPIYVYCSDDPKYESLNRAHCNKYLPDDLQVRSIEFYLKVKKYYKAFEEYSYPLMNYCTLIDQIVTPSLDFYSPYTDDKLKEFTVKTKLNDLHLFFPNQIINYDFEKGRNFSTYHADRVFKKFFKREMEKTWKQLHEDLFIFYKKNKFSCDKDPKFKGFRTHQDSKYMTRKI